MAQSPSLEKQDPIQGTDNKNSLSDAQQRPGVSGSDAPAAPGEKDNKGISAEALANAKDSAKGLGEEELPQGGAASRKDVETK